jgi:hypothetical protein
VDVDVYSALSDFPEGVDRPALAAPSPRRPGGESS